MRYKLLYDENSSGLEKQVNQKIKAGWTLLGGVSAYPINNTSWFAQAMTTEDETAIKEAEEEETSGADEASADARNAAILEDLRQLSDVPLLGASEP
jgi:Domain of unknown function (DUF1737)